MASTNKTPFLQLNKWLLMDHPKMNDFNNDNLKLDSFLQSHVENLTLHMTTEQNSWVNQPFVSGTYAGNGAATQSIQLGFQPALLFIFGQGYGPIELDTVSNVPHVHFGVAADGFGSSGVALTSAGFTVTQAQAEPLAGMSKICMNQNGIAYRYFALKPA